MPEAAVSDRLNDLRNVQQSCECQQAYGYRSEKFVYFSAASQAARKTGVMSAENYSNCAEAQVSFRVRRMVCRTLLPFKMN